MEVTKKVQSDYNSILRAKLYFFFRKSLWLYLLGMLLLAYELPLPSWGVIPSAIVYFFVFVVLVLIPVYHFSTKMLEKKIGFDAVITFSEQNIVIRHINKELTEIKQWDWIKQINLAPNAVWLVTDQSFRFAITLPKNKLDENEWEFFSSMKTKLSTGKAA
ncbi:hypothetical protein [Chitinophaga qingshengii]|uniref:YcxB family protein n=1 Tax=Chitinophaga qingshengii TaxID=1569794 RepID=A0ABR7TVS1_9BACT|nr:hypothetical protein [Chitinophaga qingshengii]MBC9933494.1 hypothetical protein [Chitinophaga qingshengii]